MKQIDRRLLFHLVDIVWGDAMEDTSVPSTAHARILIPKSYRRIYIRLTKEDVETEKPHFQEDIEDEAYNWLEFWETKEEAIKDLWNENIPPTEETIKRLGIKQHPL